MKFRIVETKNLHMDHLEDYVILYGQNGIEKFKKVVNGILNQSNNIEYSEKIDGAPAVFFGKDDNNEFIIGTKSIFNKINKKQAHNIEEIKNYYGHSEELFNKLSDCYVEFKKLNIPDNTIIQGDLLFTDDKKLKNIKGKTYITFKPNTIIYAVEKGSNIFESVKNSNVGIVLHTVYKDNRIINGNNVINDILNNNNSNAFIINAKHNNLSINTSSEDLELIKNKLNNLDRYNITNLNSKLISYLNMFINSTISKNVDLSTFTVNKFINQFEIYLNERMNKEKLTRKTDKGRLNIENKFKFDLNLNNFKTTITIFLEMVNIKKLIMKYFKNIKSKLGETYYDSYITTHPEGFVINYEDGLVKMIDRLNFSRNNKIYSKFK